MFCKTNLLRWNIEQKLTALESENGKKNEERVNKYKEAKDFLDKLTPKEFIEEKQRRILEKTDQLRQNYVEHEMYNMDSSPTSTSPFLYVLHSNIVRMNDDDRSQHGGLSNSVSSRSNLTSRLTKKDGNNNEATKKLQNFLEEKFNRMVEKGEVQELEQFEDDYPLYFEDKPEKLLEIFDMLEEKKFFLLQMMQDLEQNLEELNSGSNTKLQDLNHKINGLKENKAALDKLINVIPISSTEYNA